MTPRPLAHRALWRCAAAVCLALPLGGCPSLTSPPPDLHVLTPKTTWDDGLPTVGAQLLVAVPEGPLSLDTQRIALSRSRTTVDYFATAAWPDRAPVMIQGLLIESFENVGKIRGVGRDNAGLRADYILQTDLRSFEARYFSGTDQPPLVFVRMEAKLVKMPEREIVASLSEVQQAPAEHNDMVSIVGAFNDALGSTMKRIVQWSLRAMAAGGA